MLNVVTCIPRRNINEANQQKIRDVSPIINLQNATVWVCEEMEGEFLPPKKELDANARRRRGIARARPA